MMSCITLYLRWKMNAWRMVHIGHRLNVLRDESMAQLSETESLVAELTKRRAKADTIQAEWDAGA